MIRHLSTVFVLLCLCFGKEVIEPLCKDVIYDTVKNPHYDVIYKPGLVFVEYSREMLQKLPLGGSFSISCDPNQKRYERNIDKCVWYYQNKQYIFDENSNTNEIRGEKYGTEFFHFLNYGCSVQIDLIPRRNRLNNGRRSSRNFTCYLENSTTAQQTKMTYIIMLAEKRQALSRQPPTINEIASNNEYFVDLDSRVEIECKAKYVEGAYVANMNWYRLERDGRLITVTELKHHKVNKCRNDLVRDLHSSVWTLKLIIDKVTEQVLDRTYRCVAEKVDVKSPFQNFITDMPLQAKILGVNNQTTHQNTAYFSSWTPVNEQDASGCTKNRSCRADRNVKIIKNPEIVKSIALGIGLSITAIVIACITLSVFYSYRRRYAIRNKIKHKWKRSADVENKSYEYHVALFANDEEPEVSDFIHSELRSQLEGKWRYNVMLPQRDAALGLGEADSRVDTIAKSQKSLFVISKSILTDDWMQFALYTALKSHSRVIIVKITDIEFEEVIEKIESDGQNPIDSARKLTNVVDWEKDRDKWSKLHVQLPLLPYRY